MPSGPALVLEVATRRAVTAWAEAVDGSDSELEALASPDAISNLLHGTDASGRTRLVVRGPSVRQIRIAALSVERERFTEHRTMALDGTAETPWRVVDVRTKTMA